jgi:O-antigen/teichoic acid export membrane protein
MTPDPNQPKPTISLKRRMLGGGAWVLFGKTVTVLCTLVNEALLTRMLGQDGYGLYVIASSLVAVAAVTGQLGLHQTAVRFIAESIGLSRPGRAHETLRLVYRWGVIGAVALFILMISGPGALLVRRVWDAPELAASIGALAVWSVLMSFQVITSESFRGFKDLRFAALFGGAITGVLNVTLLTVIYLGWGHTNIGVVLRVIVVAAALSLGVGLLVLYRVHASKLPADRGSLSTAELFDTAAPLWAIVMVNNLLAHADRWILGAYLTKADVGIYGAAARLVLLVSQPLILINLLVPPYIAELYAKGEKRRLERILRQTAALAGIPAILVLFAFIFFGGPILGTFYPDAYSAGATILAILSIAKVTNVLTGSSGITMAMTGHQHILMRIAVVVSGLSIVVCFFVVRPWGSLGVATVVSAGSSLVFVLQWLATKKYTGMWTHPSIPSIDQIKSLFR